MGLALLEPLLDSYGLGDQGFEFVAGQIQQTDEMTPGHDLFRELVDASDQG